MAFENLEARLRLDASQFKREASSAGDSMSGLADKAGAVGRRMQSIGTKMTLGISTPLVLAGAGAVKAASDVEEMQSKMSVVFGDLTDDIQEWSAVQAEATGRSKFQYQEMATALQDTFVPMGFARDEAAGMSKEMSSLAVDLASFNNMDTTEALNRLRGGIVGNHENLREFGVIINQTNLGEKLEEMFGKGIESATEQEKMLARLQLVTEGTADAQGDAVRTADSFANQMRSLKSVVQEVAVAFGRELMPMARDLVNSLKGLATWFQNLDSRSRKIVVIIAAVAAAVGPLLLVFGTILALLPAMAAGFGLVSAAASPLLVPILAIVAALGLLAAAWATDFLGIRTAVTKAVKGIMANLQPLIDMIGPEFEATIEHWRNVIGDALAVVEAWWAKHGEAVMSVVGPLWNGIKLVIENVLDALITAVRVALAILRGDFSGAFELIQEFLGRQMDRFEEIGKSLIEALVNGITAAGDVVEGAIDDVLGGVRDHLPFSDAKKGPLSDLTASGEALTATFAQGARQNMDPASRAADQLASAALPGGSAGTNRPESVTVFIEMADDAEGFVDARIERSERRESAILDRRGAGL